jgi:hypothetical protein
MATTILKEEKISGRKGYEWEPTANDQWFKSYEFFPKEENAYAFEVVFDAPSDGPIWDLNFGVYKTEKDYDNYDLAINLTKQKDFLTVSKILNTIADIVLNFIEENQHDISTLSFSADKSEASRVRFYNRLSNQLADHFQTKKYEKEETLSKTYTLDFDTESDW